MIKFEKFELANGLKFLVNCDNTTQMATFNILYDVGARDENPEKTGFAHLFEHLMFGGSINIDKYDDAVQNAGGQNNAYTTNDVTNYYINLPAINIETAFWLESDRLLSLNFSDDKLNVERNVVIEEYKQRYLNAPYGDMMALIRKLAYKVHPYQWQTIGKDIAHIENATLEDVKAFFFKHYAPNNAIVAITGNVNIEEMKTLAEKWFGDIPRRNVPVRNLPQEPIQQEYRLLTVERGVPNDMLVMAFHIDNQSSPRFRQFDLLSSILSKGSSSRLNYNLTKQNNFFTFIDAYVEAQMDKGLLLIMGMPSANLTMQEAEEEVWKELYKLTTELVGDEELQKVKNSEISSHIYSQISIKERASTLAANELAGNANLINTIEQDYESVTDAQIIAVAKEIFVKERCSVLYYCSNSKQTDDQDR